MIKVKELKEGGIVRILHDGMEKEGTIVSTGITEACVNNGTQEFWYPFEELIPIPLSEKVLTHTLGFEREEADKGVKYKKGPFRVMTTTPGNFANIEVWYREDRRHFNHLLNVHELQNHHLDMTKMPLEKATVH